MVGHEVKELAIELEDVAELRLAEPRRALRDCVEHGLDVGRRARDDAEDLAGRGLLLQRLRQALFELATRRGFVRQRLAADSLRGLRTPTHRPLLDPSPALRPRGHRRWADPAFRETALAATRAVEAEPSLLGVSAHLLAIARRPWD